MFLAQLVRESLAHSPTVAPAPAQEFGILSCSTKYTDVVVRTEDRAFVQASRSRAGEDLVETIVSAEDDRIYLGSENESQTFNGRFSGLSVLRSIRELCDHVAGAPGNGYGTLLVEAFDSNLLGVPLTNAIASLALLPAVPVMRTAIKVALDEALSCQEFIDRSELRTQVERLYSIDPGEYLSSDRRALSLIYALLALGRQHQIQNTIQDDQRQATEMQGYDHGSWSIISHLLTLPSQYQLFPSQPGDTRYDRL